MNHSPSSWVEATLSSLTLEEKVGQLFLADLAAVYSHREQPALRQPLEIIRELHVGGFVLAGGTITDIAVVTNTLQQTSRLPLLFAADIESGLWFHHAWKWVRGRAPELPRFVDGGGTIFPPAMGLGATGDPQVAYELGRVTGREARAIGIHWSFAPVADLNRNPHNPIINTRAFGEDPATVASFVEAYVKGVQEERVLATLKHFPGQGDAAEDTHMILPRLPFDRKRLEEVELVPFRRGLGAGARAVMTAHAAFPELDATGRPATLSYSIIAKLLREDLGFGGVVITDGMTMQGITDHYGPDEAAVLAVEAGVDMLLVPENLRRAWDGIVSAVRSGRVPATRIDRSVQRVLEAKAWLGLDWDRDVKIDAVASVVAEPASLEAAQRAAERSITLLRNTAHLLPLAQNKKVQLVVVTDEPDPTAGSALHEVLVHGCASAMVARISNALWQDELEELLRVSREANVIVLDLQISRRAWGGAAAFSPRLDAFIERIGRIGVPVVLVLCGDPYLAARLPVFDAVVLAYGQSAPVQIAAGNALLGLRAVEGRLPVTLPRHFKRGDGLTLEAKRENG